MTFAPLALLADAEGAPVILRLLGRLHPAVVHFPIALLTVAAILETWQVMRRRHEFSAATPVCIALGTLSALAAALFGWFLDDFDHGRPEVALLDVANWTLVDWHKWVGVVGSAFAIICALLLVAAPRALTSVRLLLFLTAGLVGITGYLGGDLVFGKNHLLKGIYPPEEKKEPLTEPAPDAPIEFVRDVQPILSENCLRCHGGDKIKGKYDMKTRTLAFAGGREGGGVVPGAPDKSRLFLSMIEKDPEAKMPPPKEKQLTDKQIEIVRKWIAAGAAWPDGVELK